MNTDKNCSLWSLLYNGVKNTVIRPIYAVAGQERDCNQVRKPPTAKDCGRTGAGVLGSRWNPPGPDSPETLPKGAENPGLLRHIHNGARNRIPQCFEGASLSVKSEFAPNCVWGHSLTFSSVSPGGYRMLLSYIDKENTASSPYFVMEAAPGGQISCEARVVPTNWIRASVVSQIADSSLLGFESILDAYSDSYTASLIAVNKEFIAAHYLQKLTENVSFGAEIVARGQEPEVSSASAAGRWTNKYHSLSASLGNRGLDLCYAHLMLPHLTVAALMEVGFAARQAVATLAYEWNKQDWIVRASADSEGLVGATLQRLLGGKHCTMACAISALLNHPNNKFRLGFGVTATIK